MTLLNGRWPLLLPYYRERQWATGWEERRLDALYSVVSQGSVVWDVGAETGDMSALYASWGCKVVVVEPALSQWPMIRDVFELNQLRPYLNLPVFAAATSNFLIEDWSDAINWPAASNLPLRDAPGFVHLDEQPDETPRLRLDDIKGAAPDVITIDVEGSELEVLKGAPTVLADVRPIWFIAIHPEFVADRWGADWRDILVAFDDAGYSNHLVDARHEQHWMFLP